jgi:UDP-N-acetylenolpyruvoylglucosamine reductase
LIGEAKKRVFEEFGIRLENEIIIVWWNILYL